MAPRRRRQRVEQTPPRPTSGAATRRSASAHTPPRGHRPDWRWRSFPTFFAFVCGMLLAFLVNEGTANPVAFILLILSLLGVGYGLAHMFVTNLVVAGRLRARQREAALGADQDPEYEDVLVYDDPARTDTDSPPNAANAP